MAFESIEENFPVNNAAWLTPEELMDLAQNFENMIYELIIQEERELIHLRAIDFTLARKAGKTLKGVDRAIDCQLYLLKEELQLKEKLGEETNTELFSKTIDYGHRLLPCLKKADFD